MEFCGSPLIRVSFVATDQWASPKHRMEGFSRHNSLLIGRKNQAKFENYCIQEGGSIWFFFLGGGGVVQHPQQPRYPGAMVLDINFELVQIFNNSDVWERYRKGEKC